MVDAQLRQRGIRDPRVLEAMSRVPREFFANASDRDRAYDDSPLPLELGQTISQPYMVARTLEALRLPGRERVLEIGAGSGYQAALLAQLAREVFAVERLPALAARARARLDALGLERVTVACLDGSRGWAAHAPYQAIAVAAGAPGIPEVLLSQLDEGGRMVIPVGDSDSQRLAILTRHGYRSEIVWDIPCSFVPLVGDFGWPGPPVGGTD